MPVLELEHTCYPDGLFTQLPTVSAEVERRWWGVYTRSRQEKAVAREMFVHGVPFYLPLIPHTIVYRRSRVISHIPMFGGYLFLFASDEERVQCLQTNRVSRLIPVHDPDRLVRDLNQVRIAIESGAPLSVESRLAPGQQVKVCSGPLTGLEGTIISRQRPTRLLIAVNFLRRGVSMEVDDCMVRPLW